MFSRKHVHVIDEPEKLQLLLDKTRRKIIYTLRKTTKSISQLARELGKTPATMYCHIKKLEAAGLVELAETRVVNNNLIEKYYKLSIPSCIIGFDFSLIKQHGPVPPKDYRKMTYTLDDESINHMFSKIGVLVHPMQRRRLARHMRILFDNAATNAEQVFEDIVNQIKLDLSNQDKYMLRKVVSLIPIATFCYMLNEPQNREALITLIEEFSKFYELKM